LCPEAWLFNYTNPMSTIVRAVQKSTSIRCVGLCHGVLHTRHVIARDLGLSADDLNVVFSGINHLCWLLDVRHNGEDMYPRFRAFLQAGMQNAGFATEEDPYDSFQQVSALLTEIYGLFPSPGDRHVAEFFPYFLKPVNGTLPYGTQAGLDMTKGIFATKDTTREQLRAQAEGRAPIDPELLEDAREGERLIQIIDAIVHDRRMPELAVNVRNDGLISNLQPWAVVEVPGQISGFGVSGIGVGALPEGVAGVLRQRIDQQELIVDAALSGDRELLLQALLADPLVAATPINQVQAMLNDALAADTEQFGSDPGK
jgi:alpha-galactosidase